MKNETENHVKRGKIGAVGNHLHHYFDNFLP